MLCRIRSLCLNTISSAAFAVLLATVHILPASAGTTIEYHYDAVGNIVSIQRAGTALNITSFSPTSGPIGAEVVIYGSGFSANPSGNDVYFDETPAPVLHATSSALTVKVPAGATTGPIHVDVGADTATSASVFTVTDHYAAPEIESFAPNCGAVGTVVTVKGKNFDPAPGATQAGIAGVLANANVLNLGELSFSLPNQAVTGHIQVATPGGTTNSKGLFFVPPSGSGITCANFGGSLTPIAIGQSRAINIASGSRGVLTFDAQADDLLSLHFSDILTNPSTASLSYALYDTTGKLWRSGSTTGQAATFSPPPIPVSGTHLLSLSVGNNGSADLSVRLVRDPIIEADTDPLPLEIEIPGQTLRLGFFAEKGEWLELGLEDLEITPSNGSITVNVDRPDGNRLTSCTMSGTAGACALPVLPTDGMYQILIQSGSNVASFDLLLKSPETLTPGGAATAVTLLAGQNGSYTFEGTAGQWLGLGLSDLTIAPAGGWITVNVLRPDGGTLESFWSYATPAAGFAIRQLPTTGTYTIRIVPGNNATSFNLLLTEDATGTLTANAAAQTFAPTRIGQAANYTFNGTAGQNLNLHMSGNTFVGSTFLQVYRPDGTSLSSTWLSHNSGAGTSTVLTLNNLPTTGTYTVRVVPPSGKLGSVSVALLAETIGTLAPGGAATAITLLAGQNGSYTFEGTAGQWLGLGLSDLTIAPAGGWITVNVLRPDGGTLESFWSYATPAAGFALRQLPTTGTYTIHIIPGNNATSFNLLLTEDATGTLTANAAAQTFTPTRIGQAASYTFSGTAGQNLNLQMSGNVFVGSTFLQVHRPDGTSLSSTWLSHNSGAGTSTVLTLNNLPTTGTYTVRVVPPSGKLGSVSVALLAETIGILTPGGTTAVSLLAGQNGSYTFEGTAGQWLGLGLSDITITPIGGWITVNVLRPDGGTLESFWSYATPAAGFAIRQLPTTGTYTIRIIPGNNATSFNLLLTEDTTGTLTANAAAQTFTPTRIGQSASYTFSATAGQNLNLHMSGNTFVGYAYFYVYRPDGTQLSSTWLWYSSGAGTSTTLTLNNLPTTGTYTVRVVPPSGKLGSVSVALQ